MTTTTKTTRVVNDFLPEGHDWHAVSDACSAVFSAGYRRVTIERNGSPRGLRQCVEAFANLALYAAAWNEATAEERAAQEALRARTAQRLSGVREPGAAWSRCPSESWN